MELDSKYNPSDCEGEMYKMWEESGKFSPTDFTDGEKTFSIVMPPPNANEDLHAGHALFVAIEDVLIRYHRLLGESTVWIPGEDHAGFETQYVYEKKLNKEGKSRFDFSREDLYKQIRDYVQDNKSKMETQLRNLGASCDWSRNVFTLDPEVVKFVHKTFKDFFDKGLIYRGERIVNYCTFHGTSFSELEVEYVEEEGKIWKLRYPLVEMNGRSSLHIDVETTRPETMLGDTAVAVNPNDKRYKDLIGQRVLLPLVGREILIVADEYADPEFGTGAVKVTPAHDPNDFEIGQRHKLSRIQVIGLDGKMTANAGKYQGLKSLEARERVLADLRTCGALISERSLIHSVGKCYKCQKTIEPMVIPQWFIKVESLAKKSIEQIKAGKIKFVPERYTEQVITWYENLRDWNISRQIVWGIQIPAWFCVETNGRSSQTCPPIVTNGEKPDKCPSCGSTDLKQDPDVFDTWFSSGQWPVIVNHVNDLRLDAINRVRTDMERFYPSSIMETAADILTFWVSRMIMMGLELKNDVPFETVYLHGLVLDPKGKKMSKSKGNVISPMSMIEKYGTDAFRFGLILNAAPGAALPLPEDDMLAGKKFANKIWNISRFLQMKSSDSASPSSPDSPQSPHSRTSTNSLELSKKIQSELNSITKQVTQKLENFRFHEALEILYHSIWHEFADKFIEDSKNVETNGGSSINDVLMNAWKKYLIMLHPFMPFVTEKIYQSLFAKNKYQMLMTETWPKSE